jgi:hypothetical protein
MIWEMEGDKGFMSGNWVNAVAPMRKKAATEETPAPRTQRRSSPPPEDLDADIPF